LPIGEADGSARRENDQNKEVLKIRKFGIRICLGFRSEGRKRDRQ